MVESMVNLMLTDDVCDLLTLNLFNDFLDGIFYTLYLAVLV